MLTTVLSLPRLVTPGPSDDDLTRELRQRASQWRSNHAMRTLIDDYTASHVVMVVTAGLVTVGACTLAVLLWRRVARASSVERRWPTERRLYAAAALCCTVVGLAMGLLTAANASNALDPVPGFLMASEHPTPNSAAFDSAVVGWVRSGIGPTPAVVQQKVDARLSWQQPKAIVCGLLFLVAAVFMVRLWRVLLRRVRAGGSGPASGFGRLVVGQCALSFVALLLLVMFMANLQGSIAPVTISVLGGS